MVQESLLYHSVILKIFSGLLFLNIFIPLFFKNSSIANIRAVRISVFVYAALLTMVAFTGLIVYMLGNFSWGLNLTLMVVLFVLLSIIEFFRIRKLKRLWVAEQNMFAASAKYILLEILLVGGMISLMVIK